jgi:hypothetical protein
VKKLLKSVAGQIPAPFAAPYCPASCFGKREESRFYAFFCLVPCLELPLCPQNSRLRTRFEAVWKGTWVIHRSVNDSLNGLAANRAGPPALAPSS